MQLYKLLKYRNCYTTEFQFDKACQREQLCELHVVQWKFFFFQKQYKKYGIKHFE